MSEGEELVVTAYLPLHVACAAHCGRRGRHSLRAAIYLHSRALSKQARLLPRAAGIERETLDYRDSGGSDEKRVAPGADERGECFRTFRPEVHDAFA